ncbi:pseudouridine synthase [Rhodopirellula sallentina]|uniref:Pseudouridine synthase n=1 Tax=Rhodopirellula sallentina SM41 TaxID=1263870 RepID=M5UF79_9BACT|nr:pseudouridine synthase [Rhodopirellula sallentina]EMI54643.1 ribosomal large subunit pseudouridine synthase B [Rhodopirellula sallentina SM41]
MPRKSAPRKKLSRPTDDVKRLNQLLASAGLGSRRQCEELIREGRVEVDGEVVTQLGVNVHSKTQKVRVDGVVLKPQKLVYYAVHKPTGVVSTNSDPQGRARVIDLVPPTERVYPVGRLDRSSDGLILLTNDGELAQSLAHPRFGVQKVYRVTVAGEVKPETMRKMRQGIYIAEGLVRVDGARVIKARKKATDMEIRLREGKNREIRRILAKFGHKVQTLRRIAIGPLRLGDMPAGAYRKLSRDEIEKLRGIAAKAVAAPPEKPSKAEAAGRGGADGRGPGVGKPRDVKQSGVQKRGVKKGAVKKSTLKKGTVKKRGAKRSHSSDAYNAGESEQRRENRRPVKKARRKADAPTRDSLRVGKIIVGDEVVAENSVDSGAKAKRGKSASKRTTQRTRGVSRKRKGRR